MTAITKATETPLEQSGSILNMIERAARDPNVDIDKMERLFQMQERAQERQDNMDFNEALRGMQAEMPQIHKGKRNDTTHSTFADLAALNKAANPILAKWGFSTQFSNAESPLENHYRVKCDLSRGPLIRQYFADVPIDNEGMKGTKNKTNTHGFGSSMSYGRRYLKLMICDIATTDDDGNRANVVQQISVSQFNTIEELLKSTSSNKEKFCGFFNISSPDELPAARFKEAVDMLNRKVSK